MNKTHMRVRIKIYRLLHKMYRLTHIGGFLQTGNDTFVTLVKERLYFKRQLI